MLRIHLTPGMHLVFGMGNGGGLQSWLDLRFPLGQGPGLGYVKLVLEI